MHPRNVYVILITRSDRIGFVHQRAFISELAARCEAEGLAHGTLDWLSLRHGLDERQDGYEIQRLALWRFDAEWEVFSQFERKPPSGDSGSPGDPVSGSSPSRVALRPGRLDDS